MRQKNNLKQITSFSSIWQSQFYCYSFAAHRLDVPLCKFEEQKKENKMKNKLFFNKTPQKLQNFNKNIFFQNFRKNFQ